MLRREQAPDPFLDRKDIYDAVKWATKADFLPWNDNAQEQLNNLKKSNKQLYNGVIKWISHYGYTIK